mmetsp:Transcript_127987/g.285267  ORF Transcript_127987/g.285267 Transcript_127987/m.285267 type:complete len:299 (-) Transcript_127987:199-1095(-)
MRVEGDKAVLIRGYPVEILRTLELIAGHHLLRKVGHGSAHGLGILRGSLPPAAEDVGAEEHLPREASDKVTQRPCLVASAGEPELAVATIERGIEVEIPMPCGQGCQSRQRLRIEAQAEVRKYEPQLGQLCQERLQVCDVVALRPAVANPEVNEHRGLPGGGNAEHLHQRRAPQVVVKLLDVIRVPSNEFEALGAAVEASLEHFRRLGIVLDNGDERDHLGVPLGHLEDPIVLPLHISSGASYQPQAQKHTMLYAPSAVGGQQCLQPLLVLMHAVLVEVDLRRAPVPLDAQSAKRLAA